MERLRKNSQPNAQPKHGNFPNVGYTCNTWNEVDIWYTSVIGEHINIDLQVSYALLLVIF